MLPSSHDHDHEKTPDGWQIVTLRGGHFARERRTILTTDDRLVLIDDEGESHSYYRLNHRPELVHESIVGSAFGGKGGAA